MKEYVFHAEDPKSGMTVAELNTALQDAAGAFGDQELKIQVRAGWRGQIRQVIITGSLTGGAQ